ncbi:hypothetical protein BX616_001284 [Lobosporangium transversale]|nr:hypothetical protein BX616_001284 [Lobosporangium transversale]
MSPPAEHNPSLPSYQHFPVQSLGTSAMDYSESTATYDHHRQQQRDSSSQSPPAPAPYFRQPGPRAPSREQSHLDYNGNIDSLTRRPSYPKLNHHDSQHLDHQHHPHRLMSYSSEPNLDLYGHQRSLSYHGHSSSQRQQGSQIISIIMHRVISMIQRRDKEKEEQEEEEEEEEEE